MLRLEPGEIFANNYRLVRLIDTGGFADVWEAVFLSAGNTVALKIYPKLDVDGVKNIEDEYRNQADLSHSHLLIARYFGKDNGYPFLEMKYCGGGNASAKLGSNNEHEAVKALNHVASALEYLHENDTVHQDIKPTNFLIDKNGSYYLADLGLSLKIRKTIARYTQKAQATSAMSLNGITPPPYRAPELYDRTNVGSDPIKATDIWALGASIFEMITGDTPFGELGGINQVNGAEMPPLSDEFSKDLVFILESCLRKNTWERPKAADLVKWTQNYLYNNNYGLNTPDAAAKTIEVKAGNVGKETIVNNNSNKLGKETMASSSVQPEKQHAGSDKQQNTGKNAGTAKDFEQPEKQKKGSPIVWIIIALVAIAGIGFGVKYYMDSKGVHKISAADSLAKVDSTRRADSLAKKRVAITKPDTGKKTDTPKQPIVK